MQVPPVCDTGALMTERLAPQDPSVTEHVCRTALHSLSVCNGSIMQRVRVWFSFSAPVRSTQNA